MMMQPVDPQEYPQLTRGKLADGDAVYLALAQALAHAQVRCDHMEDLHEQALVMRLPHNMIEGLEELAAELHRTCRDIETVMHLYRSRQHLPYP